MSFFDNADVGGGGEINATSNNSSFSDTGGSDFFADFALPLTPPTTEFTFPAAVATTTTTMAPAFDEAEFAAYRRRHDSDDSEEDADDDDSDDEEERQRRARLAADDDSDSDDDDNDPLSGSSSSSSMVVGGQSGAEEEGRGFFDEAGRVRATDVASSIRLYRRAVACGYLPAFYNLACVLLHHAAPILRHHAALPSSSSSSSSSHTPTTHQSEKEDEDNDDEDVRAEALLASCKGILDSPAEPVGKDSAMERLEAEAEASEAAQLLQQLVDTPLPSSSSSSSSLSWSEYVGPAEFNLGYCFYHGLGVEENAEQAVCLYRRAADRGVSAAQSNLGSCYLERRGSFSGLSLDEAHRQAVQLYRRAVEIDGNADAKHNLGHCLLFGLGVDKDEQAAAQLFAQAANADVSIAKYRLACCIERGVGLSLPSSSSPSPPSPSSTPSSSSSSSSTSPSNEELERAFALYQSAADRGVLQAQVRLGDLYRAGHPLRPRNPELSTQYYLQAAAQGSAAAQCRLGNFYRVQMRNFPLAVEWYTRAAVQHDARAELALGYLCLVGKGTQQNPRRAFKLFRQAARRGGHRIAQFHLGLALLHGRGTPRDAKQACEWLQRSAAQGYVPAIVQVAACCVKGEGVPKDLALALRHYEHACTTGSPAAEFKLGCLYQNGVDDDDDDDDDDHDENDNGGDRDDGDKDEGAESSSIAPDFERGLALLRCSADKGYAPAQLALGFLSFTGYGGDQDVARGIRLYQDAAEKQNRVALFNLGNCYRLGCGVQENAEKAAELYSLSAQRQYKPATYNLAISYFHRGDAMNGFFWLARAASLPQSAENAELDRLVLFQLGLCFRYGRGVRRSPRRSFRCFEKAAELGLDDAHIQLAWCHARGFGVRADVDKAILTLEQISSTNTRARAILQKLMSASVGACEQQPQQQSHPPIHGQHGAVHDAFFSGTETTDHHAPRLSSIELGSLSPGRTSAVTD